jgi:hypothetical protein
MARTMVIEDIQPTSWKVRIRDVQGETHDLEFKPGKPARIAWPTATAETAEKRGSRADETTTEKPEPDETSKKPDRKGAGKKDADKKPRERTAQAEIDAEVTAIRKRRAAAEPAADAKVPEAPAAVEAPEEGEEGEEADRPRRKRRRKHKATTGKGPGELAWEDTEDDGVPGIRAPFDRGHFKILHAGGETYALFFEWSNGRYRQISCGEVEALKAAAATWAQGDDRTPPRSNLGAEAARVACVTDSVPNQPAAQPEPATPRANPPPTASTDDPPANPAMDAAIMGSFDAILKQHLAGAGA